MPIKAVGLDDGGHSLFKVVLRRKIEDKIEVMVLANGEGGAEAQATCGREDKYELHSVERIPVRIQGWGQTEY